MAPVLGFEPAPSADNVTVDNWSRSLIMCMSARFLLAVFLSGSCLAFSPLTTQAQFGQPNFGNIGGGMGGGGGMGHFSPSVTNSLNQGRTSQPSAIGTFERARQENASAKTARNYDDTFSKPLKMKGLESDASSAAVRRLLNRRQGDSVTARTAQNPRGNGSPFRIPPGLREVKNAHRIARDQPSSGSVSTESRAEATNSSP